MSRSYRVRVSERRFLNRPGHHAAAFVFAVVEDTSNVVLDESVEEVANYEPDVQLEIADCTRRISLEFDLDSPAARRNSVHKATILVEALERFRDGLLAEIELYEKRERLVKRHNNGKRAARRKSRRPSFRCG
jgi:hypothetical protein